MRRRRSARLQEKDESKLRQAYETCHFRLVMHLTDLLGSETEALDIAQEALIRFYTAIRRRRRIRVPINFLLRTANRLAIRHLQKQRRRERSLFRPPADITSDMELHQAWSNLRAAWPGLDPSEQLVAKCLLIDQMTVAEIVKSTEMSRTTVQRKISRIQKVVEAATGEFQKTGKKSGQIGQVIASIGVEEDRDPHER